MAKNNVFEGLTEGDWIRLQVTWEEYRTCGRAVFYSFKQEYEKALEPFRKVSGIKGGTWRSHNDLIDWLDAKNPLWRGYPVIREEVAA